MIADSTAIWAGAYLVNDRSNPAATYDGFFACVMTSFDALTLFKSSPMTTD